MGGCGSSTADGQPDSQPDGRPEQRASRCRPWLAGSPTPDPAAVYAQIEADVQQIRQLSAKTPVEPKLLDEAGLKANVTASFQKENPPELVAANQRISELLGLIPQGTSLEALYLKLLASQVAGYYDSDTKELYVVSRSGGLGPTERISFAHEFDHALQDQNFGLDKLQLDTIGEGDRGLARLSVAEGDATLLMSLWAAQSLTPAELLQMLQEANDPAQAAILAEMPAVLKDTLLFPYTSGAALVQSVQATGGWAAVDDAVHRPTRVDRADPPPGQVHGSRGTDQGGVSQGPAGAPRDRLGLRPAGHDGRVPARGLARIGGQAAEGDGDRGSPGLGRRPDGAGHEGRPLAGSSSTPAGTARPMPPSSRRRPSPRSMPSGDTGP